MHNALAVLASISILFSTCAAALPAQPTPSQTPSSPAQRPIAPALLATKCAFILWHKQLLFPTSAKANYIQINTLIDHANGIELDIAHLRPVGAFQSYSAVSEHRAFAIEGLLNGRNLSVSGGAGSDELVFASGGLEWRVESAGRAGGAEAWCEVGAWDGEIGEGKAGVRERRMECVFPCEKIEEDEMEQVRVELR